MSGRVVVDTNVWISALVFGGAPRAVFERVLRSGTVLVTSAELVTETRRILSAKFPGFVEDHAALRRALAPVTAQVELGTVTVEACRDPDDNRVLETALLGRASAIVSGDMDLLSMDPFESIRICRPRDWLDS